MADIRINSLPSTATSFNTDDYIAIDGASAGTRRMLAANPPFSDVTLGTSGPSVKSSLSARAPRQGLVFDGTAGATVASVAAFGTGDFTVDCSTSFASASGDYIYLGGASNSFTLIQTGGQIGIAKTGGAITYFSYTPIASKFVRLTVTRSGTTWKLYANGVLQDTQTTSLLDFTVASTTIGKSGSNTYLFNGFLSPLIYNRALSASEVVALYEAGAPAGGDYASGGANNTSLITGANSDFSSDTGYWSKAGSASIGGNQCTLPASGGTIYKNSLLTKGTKYRLSVSIVTNQTGGLYVQNYNDVGYGNITGTGTKTLEFVASGAGATAIALQNNTAGSIVIDDVTIVPIGLLLAPDAAQAGGGLTWYDTSGNAANITLPASGVTWNVPTSGKMATSLTIGGTGVGLTLAPSSGAASMTLNGPAAGSAVNFALTGTNKYTAEYVNGSDFFAIGRSGVAYDLVLKGGNFLIGGTIDGGQKLQVSGDIAVGTGNPFSLAATKFSFSSSTNYASMAISGGTGTGASIEIGDGSSRRAQIVGELDGSGTNGKMVLRTFSSSAGNVATALTLDSSQNATFGKKISANVSTTWASASAAQVFWNTVSGVNLAGSGSSYDVSVLNKNGDLAFYVPTGTQNTTFAGTATAATAFISQDYVQCDATGAYNLGNPATDGTWRFVRSANNLLIQRRESGAFVTKSTISA